MLGADGEIAQLFGPGIDDLMRRFFAARRAGDNVAVRMGYLASPMRTSPLPCNTKTSPLGRVIVKRPRPLPAGTA